MPEAIPDLTFFPTAPNGNELLEMSNQGAGSYKITFSLATWQRLENTISVGGTTTISATNYGDVVVTTTSAVTINLPSASARNGVPITIVGWNASSPNITILPNGGDTIFGNASLALTTPYGSYTLKPRINGWYQA